MERKWNIRKLHWRTNTRTAAWPSLVSLRRSGRYRRLRRFHWSTNVGSRFFNGWSGGVSRSPPGILEFLAAGPPRVPAPFAFTTLGLVGRLEGPFLRPKGRLGGQSPRGFPEDSRLCHTNAHVWGNANVVKVSRVSPVQSRHSRPFRIQFHPTPSFACCTCILPRSRIRCSSRPLHRSHFSFQ